MRKIPRFHPNCAKAPLASAVTGRARQGFAPAAGAVVGGRCGSGPLQRGGALSGTAGKPRPLSASLPICLYSSTGVGACQAGCFTPGVWLYAGGVRRRTERGRQLPCARMTLEHLFLAAGMPRRKQRAQRAACARAKIAGCTTIYTRIGSILSLTTGGARFTMIMWCNMQDCA